MELAGAESRGKDDADLLPRVCKLIRSGGLGMEAEGADSAVLGVGRSRHKLASHQTVDCGCPEDALISLRLPAPSGDARHRYLQKKENNCSFIG